jgi:hypothetical protein
MKAHSNTPAKAYTQGKRALLPAALLTAMLLVALLLGGCGARQTAGEAAPAEMSQEAPAAASAADVVAQADGGNTEGNTEGSTEGGATLGRKIVARATLELIVADAQQTADAIGVLMEQVGGYISNANLYKGYYGGSETLQGALTLRVPAERLEETMAALGEMAVSVGTRTINREDVTDQYTDLDAQLRNLEATENELREMLAEVRAKPNARPEDILAVHQRLTEIRGQIEQAQGRKNMLDNLIGLSTIDVTLTPDAATQPVVEAGWRPGVEARNALRALVSSLQVLGTWAIWFVISFLPIALLLLLPFVVLALIARAILRRRRAQQAIETTGN